MGLAAAYPILMTRLDGPQPVLDEYSGGPRARADLNVTRPPALQARARAGRGPVGLFQRAAKVLAAKIGLWTSVVLRQDSKRDMQCETLRIDG